MSPQPLPLGSQPESLPNQPVALPSQLQRAQLGRSKPGPQPESLPSHPPILMKLQRAAFPNASPRSPPKSPRPRSPNEYPEPGPHGPKFPKGFPPDPDGSEPPIFGTKLGR